VANAYPWETSPPFGALSCTVHAELPKRRLTWLWLARKGLLKALGGSWALWRNREGHKKTKEAKLDLVFLFGQPLLSCLEHSGKAGGCPPPPEAPGLCVTIKGKISFVCKFYSFFGKGFCSLVKVRVSQVHKSAISDCWGGGGWGRGGQTGAQG